MDAWTKEYFHKLYLEHADRVYRICLMYLKREGDAKDAMQDVFLKIWDKKPDFNDENHAKSWIIRTTKNYCLDILKSNWWSKRSDLPPEEIPERPEEESDPDYELMSKIRMLKEKFQVVLYLYYYEEYSVKEIADIVGKSESTIQSRLAAGRAKLKKLIETGKEVS
ncbi:MAG: sigma-70 family RNA polymerase sigma factor [Eubacterium sp.]|nr:sigma-70 family RNA polymerase sigma factor [Eubacterium sp.]